MFNEKTWKDGEKLALDYMKEKGYKIKYTNFRAGGVELDIVAVWSKKQQLKELEKDTKQQLKLASTKKEKDAAIKKHKMLENEIVDVLIVCEVKARATDAFGKGFDAIDNFKKARLEKGAKYLLSTDEFAGFQVRFDVASVDEGKVTYIENAFTD